MAGVELPVLAMEHMYIVTEEIPEIVSFGREMLPTTDYSGEIYMRQEGRGILMGTYEQDCRVWSPDTTPWDFNMQLLPDDLERLAPHLEIGFKHFPAVGRAGIKKVVNGPFTFAPDGNPLIGPVRGLRNFWSACGVMAGFAQGGGVGLALSRWMAEGDPGADVFAMDVARFGAFATQRYTNVKVQENYKRRFRIAYPNEELPAARPLRRSPVYDRLKSQGAVFGASFGLEAALWYAPPGMEAVETPTYRRSNAFPVVREECLAVRNAVGLMEITGFGKYEITGIGAEAWLSDMLAGHIPKPGRMVLTPMLNEHGKINGDFSLARLAPDRFLMIGSGVAEVYHMRWFERIGIPTGVSVRPLPGALTGFMIAGPRSRELLQRLVKQDVSNPAFKFFAVREMEVGMVPAIVARASYTGDLGYEIWVTPDYQVTLYEQLIEAGGDLGTPPLRQSCADVASSGEGLRCVLPRVPPRLHAERGGARSLCRLRQAPVRRPGRGARGSAWQSPQRSSSRSSSILIPRSLAMKASSKVAKPSAKLPQVATRTGWARAWPWGMSNPSWPETGRSSPSLFSARTNAHVFNLRHCSTRMAVVRGVRSPTETLAEVS